MSKNKLSQKRRADSHKGDFGKVLIIAGSSGMLGAGVLATRAALRAGAGLVYWAVPRDLINTANLATPEVIVISHEEIKKINPDVVAIGPGTGRSESVKKILYSLIMGSNNLIIDADGLNLLANDLSILKKSKSRIILTPHPGEMARLTGLAIDEIQRNRVGVAKDFAHKWNVRVVLKGHHTIVAYSDGTLVTNKTGNPGMATAGSGDVLTGIIAAFKAQDKCVCDAVYVHGLAGDLALKEFGECGMIASDLIDKIPKAILKAGNVR